MNGITFSLLMKLKCSYFQSHRHYSELRMQLQWPGIVHSYFKHISETRKCAVDPEYVNMSSQNIFNIKGTS